MVEPFIREIKQTPNPRLGREPFPDMALDSYLNIESTNEMTNITLVLYLRILFVQINASTHGPKFPDTDARLFYIRNWNTPPGSSQEWEEYKKQVIDAADKFWDRPPFVLNTPDHYSGFDWPFAPRTPTHRPNVDCRTRIEEASGPRDAHIRVGVV